MPDADFVKAERALGLTFPTAWRAYLQGVWFRAGWLPSGAYVALLHPIESVRVAEASRTSSVLPGAIEGGDGSRERLILDVRSDAPRVMLVDMCAGAWDDAIPQSPSLEAFLASLEDGTFDFSFK